MTAPDSAAALADIDQKIANIREAVIKLVAAHRGPVGEVGREVATAQLSTLLLLQNPFKVASIAAVALDMLAHGEQP